MAIITCRNCNGEISDKAKICPHCGSKTKVAERKNKAIAIIFIVIVSLAIWGAVVFIKKHIVNEENIVLETISMGKDYAQVEYLTETDKKILLSSKEYAKLIQLYNELEYPADEYYYAACYYSAQQFAEKQDFKTAIDYMKKSNNYENADLLCTKYKKAYDTIRVNGTIYDFIVKTIKPVLGSFDGNQIKDNENGSITINIWKYDIGKEMDYVIAGQEPYVTDWRRVYKSLHEMGIVLYDGLQSKGYYNPMIYLNFVDDRDMSTVFFSTTNDEITYNIFE